MSTRRHYAFNSAVTFVLLVLGVATSCTVVEGGATDQEVISVLAQGTALSASAIVSGQGTVRHHYQRDLDSGHVSETTTTYRVVFAGNRWRISAEGTSLKPDASIKDSSETTVPGKATSFHYEISCDGTQLVFYIPGDGKADIADVNSENVSVAKTVYQSLKDDVVMIGKGIGSITDEKAGWKYEDWQIVGRPTVGGNECIKIQRATASEDAVGRFAGMSVTVAVCVDPDKGFVWPESTVYASHPSIGNNVLVQRKLVEPRLYAEDLWGPAQCIVEQYDSTGRVTATIRTEYDADFKLNAPVDDGSLSLQLPSGTRVNNLILETEYVTP